MRSKYPIYIKMSVVTQMSLTHEVTPRSSPSPAPHVRKASDALTKSILNFCKLETAEDEILKLRIKIIKRTTQERPSPLL